MLRVSYFLIVSLIIWSDWARLVEAEETSDGKATVTAAAKNRPENAGSAIEPFWRNDYAAAMNVAEQQGKMLLIYFHDPKKNELCERFEAVTLSDPKVIDRLKSFVLVKATLATKITSEGKEFAILEHSAFSEMLRQPGIAMVDFHYKDASHYGCVVSEFPLMEGYAYDVQQMLVILGLPRGTLTQRTLIYAVRTHPDRPESTNGTLDLYLVSEAASHSRHQAQIRLQGHHQWDTRFQRINTKLPPDSLACEVCAESWPDENLVEAAIECVRCWRFSSGHWSAVRAEHPVWGYDMKRGANGIWYATGIFGRARPLQ